MNRDESLSALESFGDRWDFIVIGGGATGLGVAVEAASRGYRTLLLEQHDFAKGTSSRSTKLIHGGVRYLQQGNVSLVIEALRERGLLAQNAPHLVHHLAFVVPTYDWWEGPFYGIGLKVYDLLAGRLGLGPSRLLTKEETLERIPTLEQQDLRGGAIYYDGQFDDARLAIHLAMTLADLGGTPINYMRVTGLLKAGGVVCGVCARDQESGKEFEIAARAVINATGVFVDEVLRLDNPVAAPLIIPSQGVHLVVDKKFLPGNSAIMVPHTRDGRVMFAVPWHDKVILGTTDTPVATVELEPRPWDEEIEFILTTAAQYLSTDPGRDDVLSAFAGLRPLVSSGAGKNTAALSRDHHIEVAPSGLVTITGGKWTTYRKMGQDTIDQAAMIACLDERPSRTDRLQIHGWANDLDAGDHLHVYGSDAAAIRALAAADNTLSQLLSPRLPYHKAEVVWAVRHEMARTVEDVLARRTRALFLDAHASMAVAPEVARLLAAELTRDERWQREQVDTFCALARGYLLQANLDENC